MKDRLIRKNFTFALAMMCVTLLPVLPFYGSPFTLGTWIKDSQHLSSIFERGMAGLFIVLAVYRYYGAERRHRVKFDLSALFDDSEGDGIGRVSIRESLPVFLPLLPIVFHTLAYTLSAYEALFLGDSDFTNISEALNSTASGRGILKTPFVRTGEEGTFLGHHFSPALLLLVPVYSAAHRFDEGIAALTGLHPTHLIYGFLLWIIFLAGTVIWARLISREMRNTKLAILTAATIALAYPFWRLPSSFHFEILVLPLSGLVFLNERNNSKSFWIFLILWMSVKEDIAVYSLFYGAYLFFGFRSYRRGAGVMLLSAAYYFLIAAGPIRDLIVGGGAADFSGYFERNWERDRSFVPTLEILFAFAALPLLSIRLFVLAILPVLVTHILSFHPWHATYYGHYIYTVLPYLLLGTVRGLKKINRNEIMMKNRPDYFRAFFFLSIVLYASASDRETPPAFFPPDPKRAAVDSMLQSVPPDACVRTMIPFTPHVPLHAAVFPIAVPEGNPARTDDYMDANCGQYYLLLDTSSPNPPFYSQERLLYLKNRADLTMKPLKMDGSMILYKR